MSQITKVPKNGRAVYFCPTCSAAYTNGEQARTCEARNSEPPIFAPGEIVIWKSGYTWFDGKPDWVARKVPKGALHGRLDSYDFFMVVTAVTTALAAGSNIGSTFHCRPEDAHRWAYHVRTLGLKNGNAEGFHGWTCPDTHVPMHRLPKRMKPPAIVIADAAKLVGQTTTRLL